MIPGCFSGEQGFISFICGLNTHCFRLEYCHLLPGKLSGGDQNRGPGGEGRKDFPMRLWDRVQIQRVVVFMGKALLHLAA